MIQITIQPGTAGEMSLIARALCAVLDLREGAPAVPATAVEKIVAEPVPAAEEKVRKPRAKKTEALVVEQAEPALAAEEPQGVEQAEPAPAAEESQVVEHAEPAPAAEAAKPAVTLEVVRSLAAGLSQQGKAAQVKQAIADLGAARLTDLDPKQFGTLHKALLAL